MKFYQIRGDEVSTEALEADFREARQIGVIRLGSEGLFFRVKLKQYYIPYGNVTHCFRRVLMVPARMCCGKGDFQIEHLVIGDEEGEIAQIQLPGTRAAKELMNELQTRMPDADFSAPKRAPHENTQSAGIVGGSRVG